MAAAVALAATGAAQAQDSLRGIEPAPVSYLDFKAGPSKFSAPCGNVYSCDRKDKQYGVTLGRELSPNHAVELGYTNFGKVQRGGGESSAKGLSVNLVGRLPMDRFAVFGKVGATYAKTSTDVPALTDIPGGTVKGWGVNYGVGMSYDVAPGVTVLTQWEEAQVKFAGDKRENVHGATVGVRFKF